MKISENQYAQTLFRNQLKSNFLVDSLWKIASKGAGKGDFTSTISIFIASFPVNKILKNKSKKRRKGKKGVRSSGEKRKVYGALHISVLVFGCWLMNQVTYLKLREK